MTRARRIGRLVTVALLVMAAAGCGPEVGDHDTHAQSTGDAGSAGLEGTDSATSPATGSATSSTEDGESSTNGDETSDGCESGVWRGRLSSTSIFSPRSLLTDCASNLTFRVEGLGFGPGDCDDLGMFELSGLLCPEPAEASSATLYVDAIVGPCRGTCEELGGCREPGWICNDNHACDLLAQDCADEEKCVPWPADGGPSFIATACRPVDRDPDSLGESCSQYDRTLGIDSCDVGLLCWAPERGFDSHCIEICDPDGLAACVNGRTCVSCATLPALGLCLPPEAEPPIAECGG